MPKPRLAAGFQKAWNYSWERARGYAKIRSQVDTNVESYKYGRGEERPSGPY